MNSKSLHILYFIVALLLFGCSAERNNPLSKTYHNTTARYNGYFLAKEKISAIENTLQEQMQYDYNQVLPIYPTLDSTASKALATDLEDVLKKASYPIQYHKNSKWVDNSYILVGKANYYQMKFAEAARSFKYVNATSKNPDDRHEALVWLMRTFMKMGEMDNALQVSDYLRKERLNRDNARELYLARAQYYNLQQDTAAVIENLALSLPNFKEKDDQSRVRFTLAQLYQLTDQDKEAFKQYSKILRNNPPYDLGFFSRLNLGQVSELTDERDKERIAGYYEKLLKDDKNKEYRDKIYYEMAQFELRQQNYDKALDLLEKSLRTPGAIQSQNAYSYVSAGEIYFDNLNKYNLAAAYYDSAAQVYPNRAPEYEAVVERRDILADFATQYSIIQTQDSLQRLARMRESERNVYLQQLAQQQEEKRLQEIARQEQQQANPAQENNSLNRNRKNGQALTDNNAGGVWYFDNPVAMASARAEFTRRWGDRPLQDFWRIRSRGETGNEAQVAQTPTEAPANEQSAEERSQALIQNYLKDIPLTNVALARSEKQTEDAYFRMANIYSQHLKDPAKATQAFEELLRRYPNTEHAADAYYSLYLLYGKANDKAQQQVYYSKIKQHFPNTTYARLVDDSDFMSKNAANNLKAHQLYDEAFSHYEAQEYEQATSVINTLVSQYPLNDIKDKVAFLDAMVTARTQKPEALRLKLNHFVSAYPGSPLQQQAKQLLASYQELEQKNLLRNEAPAVQASRPQDTRPELSPEEKVSTEIATATASTSDTAAILPPAATEKSVPQQQKPDTTALPDQPEVKQSETAKPQQPIAEATKEPAAPADSVGTATPVAPPVDPMAYKAAEDSAYYFVLIYPKDEASFKDVQAKFEKYNSTYYKKQNLSIDSLGFSNDKAMLVIQGFTDPDFAQSFNIKQKAPQSPIGRIRGVDFVTFVISSANYQKLLQKKDLDVYLTFFKNNY